MPLPVSPVSEERIEKTDWLRYCDAALWHEAALVLPLMSDEELDGLGKDIRKNGLQSSVVLFEGKVLDGRNRLLACRKFGATPFFCTWKQNEGQSPLQWSLSQNLYRRNLTAAQEELVIQRSGIEASQIKARHLHQAFMRCADKQASLNVLSLLYDKSISMRKAVSLLRGDDTAPAQQVEPLLRQLIRILPADGDGCEHALILMLEEACSETRGNVVSKDALPTVLVALRRLSSMFFDYAARIEKGTDV